MNTSIVISGYGEADLTFGAAEMLQKGGTIILHTGQCYLSRWLESRGLAFTTLDQLYETADNFDDLTAKALETLERSEENIFCVMDTSDETAKTLLRKYPRTQIYGGSALSGLELRSEGSYKTLTAAGLSTAALSSLTSTIIREIDTRLLAGDVKLLLEDVYGENADVFFRMPEGSIVLLPIDRIDRLKSYDHRCACLINPSKPPIIRDFEGLKLISASKEVKDACLTEEALARSLADVVQSITTAEMRGLFTEKDVCMRAADIISEGEKT